MHNPKNIWFLRHGESLGNVHSRDDRSHIDLINPEFPLTRKGRAQAKKAGVYIKKNIEEIDAILVSDFLRAQQTADMLDLPNTIYREEQPMLGEQDYGLWYVHTNESMAKQYPDEIRRKEIHIGSKARSYHWRPLGGDSARSLETRVWIVWQDLCQRFPDRNVLLVGHGTWCALFVKIMLRLRAKDYEERFAELHPTNAEIFHFHNLRTKPHNFMTFDREHDSIIPYDDKLKSYVTH